MIHICTFFLHLQADTTAIPSELFANNNEVIVNNNELFVNNNNNEVIDINSKSPSGFFSSAALFAPTIPPLFLVDPTLAAAAKTSPRFNVNLDAIVRDGSSSEERTSSSSSFSSSSSSASLPLVNNAAVANSNNNNNANGEFKSSLLEKYSRNKVKNGIFHKAESSGAVNSSRGGVYEAAGPLTPSVPVFVSGIPLGANTDIHRSYGGKQLSQADFESQILGVSSATEISVKSMICVKGRCFNADDMGGKLIT